MICFSVTFLPQLEILWTMETSSLVELTKILVGTDSTATY